MRTRARAYEAAKNAGCSNETAESFAVFADEHFGGSVPHGSHLVMCLNGYLAGRADGIHDYLENRILR